MAGVSQDKNIKRAVEHEEQGHIEFVVVKAINIERACRELAHG